MKTIKFFSLAMLLSLVWVACKDNSTSTETTAVTAETLSAEVLAANKVSAAQSLTELTNVVTNKITELETALASASDDAKAGLNSQLETYKKLQADLQALSTKVAETSIENWSTVAVEVETLHGSVKTALMESPASSTPAGAINKGGSGGTLTKQ